MNPIENELQIADMFAFYVTVSKITENSAVTTYDTA